MATAQRLADTATAEPELEPEDYDPMRRGCSSGRRDRSNRLRSGRLERLAHSLRLVFPRMTAPASQAFGRRRIWGGIDPAAARAIRRWSSSVVRVDVVLEQHGDAMHRTARPFRLPFLVESAGKARASGLTSSTDLRVGPRESRSRSVPDIS